MIAEQPPKKPTYRELWWDQGATLLDIWQGGTRLDENTLISLWNHCPVAAYVAQQALNEYNKFFDTSYALDQVNITTLESLGDGRRLQVREGECSMAGSWTWEY